MDMSLVFANTETEETDNKTREALERINNFQPTFAERLKLWVKEYCVDFTYQYTGIRCDDIFSNEIEIDYQFVCKMPLEIKIYFKGLIDDIRNQIKESYIALYDYYDFYEDEDDAEKLGHSTLPTSVKDFIQVTDASYELIKDLITLACDEDTYKFVISDNCFYDNRTFSDLVVTSNALMVTKKMVKAAEEAGYAIKDILDNYDEGEEDYEKVRKLKWHDICHFDGNKKAYNIFNNLIGE
ncbi:MAG: hypothetical protein IKY94_05210 [Lachnospiraceae bacterium]|nr:hypothetical protein [Lachnospiraceae bacterium]